MSGREKGFHACGRQMGYEGEIVVGLFQNGVVFDTKALYIHSLFIIIFPRIPNTACKSLFYLSRAILKAGFSLHDSVDGKNGIWYNAYNRACKENAERKIWKEGAIPGAKGCSKAFCAHPVS